MTNRYKRYVALNNNHISALPQSQAGVGSSKARNNNFVRMHQVLRLRWHQFWEMLDQQFLEKYPALATKLRYVEGVTGVKKEQVLLGFILLVILYVVTAYFASISGDFLSIAYPLYSSVKAQEASSNELREVWLRYWIVHSSLVLTEYLAGRVLCLIPAYHLMRIFFIMWCMSPYAENGSHFVYYKVIQPFYLHHQEQMESAFSLASAEMTNLSRDVLGTTKEQHSKEN